MMVPMAISTSSLARVAILLAVAGFAPVTLGQTVRTTPAAADAPAAMAKPITTDRSAIGDLLRKWAAEGTAAGNTGDFYDNRDRGHSMLSLAPYPQLQAIVYSEADRKLDRDWGLQTTIRSEVVFGNSSTSSPATVGGCNTRILYASRGGLELLHSQYRLHNLYLYPAHQDYLPGHDGLDGGSYGDLFPTNTPYVITSQGSSYTDQPFMRAIPFALAALRPAVKAKLVNDGLLMPTLQAIFRLSNKQVATPQDYLTAKAHPAVFDGNQIDPLKMVNLAHDIDLQHIPPLAQIKLVEAEDAKPGRDYFDPYPTEALGTTPSVIARIFRGRRGAERPVVSAESSVDANGLPLTYHWVILRGDAGRIKITPKDKSGAIVEIIIPYHDRAPIAPGDALESNRVEIGLIVHNGTWYSAPAFVTSFTLDSEARTYDEGGRILEIGHDMAESVLTMDKWPAVFNAIRPESVKPGVGLLLARLSAGELSAMRRLADEYIFAGDKVLVLEKQLKDTEQLVKTASPLVKPKLEAQLKQARDAIDTASKTRENLVATKQPGLNQPLKSLLQQHLRAMAAEYLFYPRNAVACGSLTADMELQRKRLLAYGIISQSAEQSFVLNPLLDGAAPAEQRLSRYQRALLAAFNGELLASIIPGVKHESVANLVDFRLVIPKHWRDVYHYDPAGHLTGWTRYDGQDATEFTPNGEIMVSRDPLGRPRIGRSVIYQRLTPASYNPRSGPDPTPLTFVPGPRLVRYAYDSDNDFTGHMEAIQDESAGTRPAPAAK